jgi:hypothetical protein
LATSSDERQFIHFYYYPSWEPSWVSSLNFKPWFLVKALNAGIVEAQKCACLAASSSFLSS